jgi:signal recognition particle receptor subunit beta
VVFIGPFGVGKTTALRCISDIPVVSTEALSSEAAELPAGSDKLTTTVAFDYGEWQFPDGPRVALFGMPGQDRFETLWRSHLAHSSAVVVWLYGDRDPELALCQRWLDILARCTAMARMVVAVTRVPAEQADQVLARYQELVGRYHPFAPVLLADPRLKGDVLQAVSMGLTSPIGPLTR